MSSQTQPQKVQVAFSTTFSSVPRIHAVLFKPPVRHESAAPAESIPQNTCGGSHTSSTSKALGCGHTSRPNVGSEEGQRGPEGAGPGPLRLPSDAFGRL